MAVLVTGGAGYIGSVTAEQLIETGERVVVLDNLSTGHRAAVPSGAIFVEGDLRDSALLRDLFHTHDIDTVVHFAADSLVAESVSNPMKYFDNNVEGTHSLLKAMVAAGTSRFILSSTCATYGYPEAVPITEDLPTNPINPYGLSKLMIEQILDWYDRAYGMRFVALRYFNACGATIEHGEDHDPETHIIPNVFRAVDGVVDKLTVFGGDYDTPDGTCIRDYIHIVDLADAHIKAMHHLRRGGSSDIFNLGTETGNSVLEVVDSVKRVTGKDVPYVIADRRPGDADKLVASAAKAHDILGWQPQKGDIDTIVQDAWTWHLAHPNGYED